MMKKLLLVCLTSISFSISAQTLSQDKSLNKVLALPNKEDIQSRIKFLADDKLQGRKPGSPGYQMAVDYVIDQFKKLEVAPKGDDGYLQKVVIRTGKVDTTKVSFSLNNKVLAYGKEVVVLPDMNNENTSIEGEVIFVGQGIYAPQLKHDDFAGLDVKGKVVLFVSSIPDNFPSAERAHFTSTVGRAEIAARKGAIGAIAINITARQYTTAYGASARGVQGIVNKDGRVTARGTASHPNMKFYAVGKDSYFNPIIEKLQRGDMLGKVSVTSATSYTEFVSYNVVGWIPGSDPQLKNEFVIHTAHLDHLGIRAKVNGDSIYNGAHDNASGVACALEIAKLYKKAKIKRSVIVALVTAEELGTLGSTYFAANPPVDKKNIVADINTDMPTLIAPLLSIVPHGAWNSSLMNEVKQATDFLGLEISEDYEPEQRRFTRSDQYSFVLEGIPALALKYGLKTNDPSFNLKAKIEDWTKQHYHKPSDEYREDAFDWDAAISYVRLNFLVGYQIANTLQRPTWNKGDFFGETFKN